MKLSKLVGQRIKETPRDAQTVSHIFMIRGGYVRLVSAGVYSLLPLAKRVVDKIEAIVREEMEAIDGQEILMPVVLPMELWDESGRSLSVGDELLRFRDRNDKPMLLAMTHEEAVVHLARTEINSYKQLPVMVFQIQTKYRDEARPRAGLIRVREFTMKDAYSFHENQECLDAYYSRVHQAYENVFRRVGLSDCLSIESDAGMMGGAVSHEFMAVADCGEDTLFVSPDGKYRANREIATSGLCFQRGHELALEKVHTPGIKSIDDLASFLSVKTSDLCKVVFYVDKDECLVIALIRGDFEVNEAKLKRVLGSSILNFANDQQISEVGAVAGFASVLGVDLSKARVIVDRSVEGSSNLVCGANEVDYHFKNFNFYRDFADLLDEKSYIVDDIAIVREGDPCPISGEPLILKRGIEVGNIFQLGTKYTDSMNCTCLDKNGKAINMIMGCYGIGIGRTMAAVIEQSHDKFGPIWPMAIAPFQVHICVLDLKKGNTKEIAEKIYSDLLNAGVEVLLDDRNEKPGSAFNDADLIGVPLRLIVSPRNIENGVVEFKMRDGSEKELINIENTKDFILNKISSLV